MARKPGSSLNLELPANAGPRELVAMLNERLRLIAERLDTLSGARGTVAIGADLDMTGHKILNLGRAVDSADAVALGQGNRRWLTAPTTLAPVTTVASAAGEKKITFGIGIETPIVVRADYTNHGLPETSGLPSRLSIDCKTPPATSDLVIDILKRTKTGSTWGAWTSLYTVKPRYPVGTIGRLEITTGFSAVAVTALTDMLRIDVIATDGVAQDCEVVQEWA